MTNSLVGDAVTPMRERPNAFDLIVAADVFVYVGDLAPLFAAVGTALTADGLFAFSVETREGDGFKLEPDDALRAQPLLRRGERPRGRFRVAPHPVRVNSARSGRRGSGPHLRIREDSVAGGA